MSEQDEREAAVMQDAADWYVDHEAEPGIARNAFLRGYDAGLAAGYRKQPERYAGESEPIARNPVLRGVDLAMDRLVRSDCFTERTLRILDSLRAEVLGASNDAEVRASYKKEEQG